VCVCVSVWVCVCECVCVRWVGGDVGVNNVDSSYSKLLIAFSTAVTTLA
jgi:hypothetical protein